MKKLIWSKSKFWLFMLLGLVISLCMLLSLTNYVLIPTMTKNSEYYQDITIYTLTTHRIFPLKEPRFNSEILPYDISYVINETDETNKTVVKNGDVAYWEGGVPIDDYHIDDTSTKDLFLRFIQLRAANTSIHYRTLCEDVDALRWTYRTIDEFFLRDDAADVLQAAAQQISGYDVEHFKTENQFTFNERLGLMLSQLKTKYPIRQTIYQLYIYSLATDPEQTTSREVQS